MFFRAGFVLDGLEEPAFDVGAAPTSGWRGTPEIPPILVARMRPVDAMIAEGAR